MELHAYQKSDTFTCSAVHINYDAFTLLLFSTQYGLSLCILGQCLFEKPVRKEKKEALKNSG